MFEIVEAGKNTFYINLPSKIGIYKISEKEVVFIDSGNDKGVAKRALKNITEKGWELKAIFNTHCHADHVGGNAYLQEQTGCKIYCPKIDCGAVNDTVLNPIMLYGGYPVNPLFHRFYFAGNSVAEPLTEDVLPEGLEIVPLVGHTLGMVGFKTSDNVYFVADTVSTKETLERYPATYIVSIPKAFRTLDYLETLDGTLYIPSHTEPVANIKELTEPNRQSMLRFIDRVLKLCQEPLTHEQIVKKVFSDSTIPFNMVQYALISSTIKSYTSYLVNSEQMELLLEDYEVKFKTV